MVTKARALLPLPVRSPNSQGGQRYGWRCPQLRRKKQELSPYQGAWHEVKVNECIVSMYGGLHGLVKMHRAWVSRNNLVVRDVSTKLGVKCTMVIISFDGEPYSLARSASRRLQCPVYLAQLEDVSAESDQLKALASVHNCRSLRVGKGEDERDCQCVETMGCQGDRETDSKAFRKALLNEA
ncbi:hypothetical protein BSKO_00210 [Bryopsis sp. KO-2023]|nr:hypothetical protein BSKO_00210 [Bryopsis sp. KO-2023]